MGHGKSLVSNEGGIDEGWYDADGNQLTGSSTLLIDPVPGTYTFIYEATDGLCFDSDTVIVTIYETPEVDAGEDLFVFLDEPFMLGGDPTTVDENTVLWLPNVVLEDSTAFNPEGNGLGPDDNIQCNGHQRIWLRGQRPLLWLPSSRK